MAINYLIYLFLNIPRFSCTIMCVYVCMYVYYFTWGGHICIITSTFLDIMKETEIHPALH